MHDIQSVKDGIDRWGEEVGEPDLDAIRRGGTRLRRRRHVAVGMCAAAAAAAVAAPVALSVTGGADADRDQLSGASRDAAPETRAPVPSPPTTSGPEVGEWLSAVVRRHAGDVDLGEAQPLDRYMSWPARPHDPVRWQSVYQWEVPFGREGGLISRWHLYPVPGEASPGFSCDDLAGMSPDSTCRTVPVAGGSVRVADYRLPDVPGWVYRSVIYSDPDFTFEVSASDAVRADTVGAAAERFELSSDELVSLVVDADLRVPEPEVLPPNEQAAGADDCGDVCGGR